MNIYETIPKVMESIGAVTKDKKNTSGQTFMYRGIDDVMNALSPAMTQFKLFVVPEVLEQLREERTSKTGTSLIYSVCKIKYTFYAEDGSNISAVVIGEAFDSGDKATNKAMSVAFKYACFQVFCIPTEEMIDPDSEVHEFANKGKDTKSKQTTANKADPQDNIPKTESEMDAAQQLIAGQKIGQAKVTVIKKELERTGVSEKAICSRYKVSTLGDITEELFPRVLNALQKTKSKEVA
jgi:hypothetical protein